MALIDTQSLTMRYSSEVTALTSLTVTIEPGIVGLVGANGAGKSTFLKLLLGLLHPTAGQIRVLGLDPTEQGDLVRARVGYMPENDCLPPDISAAELVTHLGRVSGLPKVAARERASEALRHVGLYEERFRQIGGYSTGMRQRVKLAQAIVGDPDLVLLDEPTNGLDPEGRDAMLGLVQRIGTDFGISIVICSHLLGEVERICTSLVAVEGGRLLRSASISAMTSRRDQIAVEVASGVDDRQDPTGALAAALSERGLPVRRDQELLLVSGNAERPTGPPGDDGVYDVIVATAARLGVPLHRLEQRRHHVTELFVGDRDQQRSQ
jgi:ABC-2 type transport system ATP-binding protein